MESQRKSQHRFRLDHKDGHCAMCGRKREVHITDDEMVDRSEEARERAQRD